MEQRSYKNKQAITQYRTTLNAQNTSQQHAHLCEKAFMKKLALLIFLSITAYACAEDDKPAEISSVFMQNVEDGEYTAAFNYASLYWPLPKPEIDALAYQTQNQLSMIAGRYGKITGTELIKTNKLGESWVRYTYLQKFENHSIAWNLVFYKPEDTWKVNAIIFNDQIHLLFDQ